MTQTLRSVFRAALSLVVLMQPLTGALFAQEVRPLSIEDALRASTFAQQSPVTFSPDGKWLVYVVIDNRRARTEVPNEYVLTGVPVIENGDIWISNVETGAAKCLTDQKSANWNPSWSPDGRYLAFLSNRGGKGQTRVWLWDANTEQIRPLSNLPVRAVQGLDPLAWSSDSGRILVPTIPDGLSVEEYVKKMLAPAGTVETSSPAGQGSTVSLYEGGILSSPSVGMINQDAVYRRDLAWVDVRTGQADFVVRGRRFERYALSPDGSTLAFAVTKEFERPGTYRRFFDLVALNLAAKKERVVASNLRLNDVFTWSPDSAQLGYAVYGEDNQSYELYVVSIHDDAPRRIGRWVHTVHEGLWLSPIWSSEQDYVMVILDGRIWRCSIAATDNPAPPIGIDGHIIRYVLSQRNTELWFPESSKSEIVVAAHNENEKVDGFWKLDLVNGKSVKLLEGGQSYINHWPITKSGPFLDTVSPDGKHIAYIAEDAGHASNVWIASSDFSRLRQLTDVNPQFSKYKMGSAQLISWLTSDGQPLHGALLLPSNYQPGKAYPLVVRVYPGVPTSYNLDQFAFGGRGPLNMQLLATRGYAVLFPDETEEVGLRGDALVKSVLPGVSKVVEMGIADPEHLGILGHSQGGFAVLEMLVKTKRFKAAVAADGWGDSTGYYGAMDDSGTGYQYGQAEFQLGGAPWQLPLTYLENSPVYQLDRIETPLLLVHGSKDDIHPAFLSDQVFVGLRRLGKRIEYAKYQGEGHAPSEWSFSNQADFANRMIGWFNHYLKDEPDAQSSSKKLE